MNTPRLSPVRSSTVYRRVSVSLVVLCLVAVAGGCSSTPDDRPPREQWMDQYIETMRQSPDDADEKLAELVDEAPSPDEARSTEFERGRKALRADEFDKARRHFQRLWDERDDDSVASRSVYELGRLAWEFDGDRDEAHRLLQRAIVDTTPWAGAELALDFLIRIERGDDRIESLYEQLTSMSDDVDDETMGARLHLERGRLLADDLDRPNDSLAAFRTAYDHCPECAATDDALYEMGMVYERHQRWEAARSAYAIVADRVDPAAFIGTYTSQRAADARFRMGMVELVYRGRYDTAADDFETYIDDFPNHRQTDDAAWHLVSIERLTGTEESHRRALEQFVEDYEHSRYVEQARRQLAEVT